MLNNRSGLYCCCLLVSQREQQAVMQTALKYLQYEGTIGVENLNILDLLKHPFRPPCFLLLVNE